jgi:hypothetical protein
MRSVAARPSDGASETVVAEDALAREESKRVDAFTIDVDA